MRFSLVVVAIATLLFGGHAFAQQPYRIGAVPDWVEDVAIPSQGVTDARSERSDVQRLLYDRQERVDSDGVESYRRFATRITSPTGIESESEIPLEFDPTYEKLTLHRIVIHRDGAHIDALRSASLQSFQVERDLERRIYDRRLTVHAILSDVRVGDVVEYSYTREGLQPALGGKYAGQARLADDIPVKRLRFRVVWPKARPLRVGVRGSNAQPEVKEVGNERSYVWDLAETPAVSAEDRLPIWFEPYPVVQLSEFTSWNEVANWAVDLYAPHRRPGPRIAKHVAEWSRLGDTALRLGAALRFVQDDVRYLGVEVGPHSLEPHDVETSLERRFGDCKDKSLLLVSLLEELGVRAEPALVHTSRRHKLLELEASPYAFDHVIVHAYLDGKELWLDPTTSYQRGSVAKLMPPLYEKALLVHAESSELTTIPSHTYEEPAIQIHEHFTVGPGAASVAFAVTTRYLEDEADNARMKFASDVIAERERSYLNFYAQKFPSIELRSPMTTKNDDAKNEFLVDEGYSIGEFWRDDERGLYAWSIGEHLEKPRVAKRTMPLAIVHPIFVRHVLDVDLPDDYELEPVDTALKSAALEFRARSSTVGRKLTVTYEFRTLSDHVLPADVASHLELLDSIDDALTYRLERKAKKMNVSRPFEAFHVIIPIGLAALVLTFGASILAERRRHTRASREEADLLEGSTAHAPVLVESAGDIAAHARRLRCNCLQRANLVLEEASLHEVRYLGQTLMVGNLVCPACPTLRPRHFLVLEAEERNDVDEGSDELED